MHNKNVNNALIRIFPQIDLNKIIVFINDIECFSEIIKKFYIELIKIRYSILESVYQKLN